MNTSKSVATAMTPAIAAYSVDPELVDMIRKSKFSASKPSSKKQNLLVRDTTSNVADLADCDAMIYDLDLAEGDVLRAKEDILHLKLSSLSKPLILVGQKGAMKSLLETENVDHLVNKRATKPLVTSQLGMMVESTIKGNVGYLPVSKPAKRSYTVFAFSSSFVAVVLAVVTMMTFSTTTQSVETVTSNNAASSQPK